MSRLESSTSNNTGLLTYEIYRTIQGIEAYSQKVDSEYVQALSLPPYLFNCISPHGLHFKNMFYLYCRFLKRQRLSLSVTSFHGWFKGSVADWVRVAQARVKERLDRAIELDTIVKASDNVPFSSSAVDAHAFFLQVRPKNASLKCFFACFFFSPTNYRLSLFGRILSGRTGDSHWVTLSLLFRSVV